MAIGGYRPPAGPPRRSPLRTHDPWRTARGGGVLIGIPALRSRHLPGAATFAGTGVTPLLNNFDTSRRHNASTCSRRRLLRARSQQRQWLYFSAGLCCRPRRARWLLVRSRTGRLDGDSDSETAPWRNASTSPSTRRCFSISASTRSAVAGSDRPQLHQPGQLQPELSVSLLIGRSGRAGSLWACWAPVVVWLPTWPSARGTAHRSALLRGSRHRLRILLCCSCSSRRRLAGLLGGVRGMRSRTS